MFIGSADWMPRNLDRRVEAVTPVEEPALRQQLERLLELYLADDAGSWDMQSDGSFSRRCSEGEPRSSQLQLIDLWRNGITEQS